MTVTEPPAVPGDPHVPDVDVASDPAVRGWYHRPGDPAGVTRWFTGRAWTNQLTGGTAAQRSQAGIVAAPSRRTATAGLPPVGDPVTVLPSVLSTVLVTLFFGPFGVVPAAVYTALAGHAGRPTPKYWAAFVITVVVIVLVALVVAVVVP